MTSLSIRKNGICISPNPARIVSAGSTSKKARCIISRESGKRAIAATRDCVERPACTCPLASLFDSHNDLYVCDSGSNRIRRVDHETGIITTVVGTGQFGFNGDGPALEINLTYPAAIAFDGDDVLYIADTQAHRIRRYDPGTGTVTTIAGTWSVDDDAREQPLVARNLVVLSGDSIGIDFSDDHGWLRPECSDGLDLSLYLDDGRPALEARLYDIVGIAVDSQGDVYCVDKGSNRVRKIDRQYGRYLDCRRRLSVRL